MSVSKRYRIFKLAVSQVYSDEQFTSLWSLLDQEQKDLLIEFAAKKEAAVYF